MGGKYNPNRRTYHEYAMQLYTTSEYLDSEFPEEYIMSSVIQDVDYSLEGIMALYIFKDMVSLCQYLIKQEWRRKNNDNFKQVNNRYRQLNNENNSNNNGNNPGNKEFNNYRGNFDNNQYDNHRIGRGNNCGNFNDAYNQNS